MSSSRLRAQAGCHDGRQEVLRYDGEIVDGRALAVVKTPEGFTVRLADRTVRARRILVTTGLTDQLPDISRNRRTMGPDGGALSLLSRLENGILAPVGALAVAARMVANADILSELGLTLVDHPSGMGQHIPADSLGRTSIPGVWAAGNVTHPTAQLISAATAGAMAAAAINGELIAGETRAAVQNAETALSS